MVCRHRTNLPRLTRQSAFTLIELMISVAIALVLILGVNQVFKIGAQTVGAGQAFSQVTRDERVAHFSVYTDVHNATTVNQPALLISSQRVYAFNTQQDQSNEPSGVPQTITINGQPIAVSNVLSSSRNFRVDTLGFFASGDLYRRQTADDGNFVSTTSSSNAYLWYGHLTLPNNIEAGIANPNPLDVTNWFGPGAPDGTAKNDNNRFAADWILGRVAMLFVPSPPTADTNYFKSSGGSNPLAMSNMAPDNSLLYSSRYDEVKSTIAQFNTEMAAVTAPMAPWPTGPATFRSSMFFRYEANPFPHKPLTAATMAGVAPIFLRHCSQFIVEYAGDYLTQDPTSGAVTGGAAGMQGDGVVDFIVVNGQRKIRWYGFPRDTTGDGHIQIADGDVVPLRDVLQAAVPNGAGQSSSTQAPWETFNTDFTPVADYGTTGVPSDADYVCSWGPESSYTIQPTGTASATATQGLPRMLRITIALDDPNGRLASPQIYEYVIDFGAQQ